MDSRPPCPTPRRRRRARFTSGRRRWRLPTRKASRSASKASGLMHRSGGDDPRRSSFGPYLGAHESGQTPLYRELIPERAVVVHIGALWNQFAMDDVAIIVWNPLVQSVGGVWRAFGAPYWPANLGGAECAPDSTD